MFAGAADVQFNTNRINLMNDLPTINFDGRTYGVRVTYADVLRVREQVGVDLFAIAERGDFGVINSSIEKVVNVVFRLLHRQLKDNYGDLKTAKEAFENALDGETLEQVVNAWQEAMINFIPCLAVREAARLQLQKMTQAQALATIQMIIDTIGLGESAKPSDTPELSASNQTTTA